MPKLRNIYKLLDSEVRDKNIRVLKYWLRDVYWQTTRPNSPEPVFIIGCSRSGTTVTYETITAAAQLLSFGHELPELWDSLWGPHHNNWESEAAGSEHACDEHRDAVLSYFFQHLGLGQVLDKTCINVMRLPYLYALFPKAKFIFIQRDGRDNISSMMDGWRQHGHFGLSQFLGESPYPVNINKGEFKEWAFFLPPGWCNYNEAPLEEVCAYQWITANRMALDAKKIIPSEQWIHLRYEDIFDRPVEMFKGVFDRLEIPFSDALHEHCATLNKRPTSIVSGPPRKHKWQGKNREAIEHILNKIQPLMQELGYDIDS